MTLHLTVLRSYARAPGPGTLRSLSRAGARRCFFEARQRGRWGRAAASPAGWPGRYRRPGRRLGRRNHLSSVLSALAAPAGIRTARVDLQPQPVDRQAPGTRTPSSLWLSRHQSWHIAALLWLRLDALPDQDGLYRGHRM